MPEISLEILTGDARWHRIPRLCARLRRAAAMALAHVPKSRRFSCTVTVLLTNDRTMRKLNRDFRGLDKPTNVLSFPQFAPRELAKKGKTGAKITLGDIALGYQYIVAESKNNHKILINHVIHLMLHGILHLFGYDHVTGAGAVRMERLEKKVMAGLGLPNPYAPQSRESETR